MTIPDLIREAERRGLRVNNLFQLDGGGWRANVRRGMEFHEFGEAETPEGALHAALSKADEPVVDFLA